MSNTATVEVLTAEVRVLMVGSRQVTVGVYNQLDWLHHSRIEPFGRVNPKDADRASVYVIGRDADAGQLSRAKSPSLTDELDNGPRREGKALAAAVLADVKDEESAFRAAIVLEYLDLHGVVSYIDRGRSLLEKAMLAAHVGSQGRWFVQDRLAKARVAIRERQPLADYEPDAHDEHAARIIRAHTDAAGKARDHSVRVKAEWSALPLIVLAGLR